MGVSVLHLRVNGTPHEVTAPDRRTLADLLRYDLGLCRCTGYYQIIDSITAAVHA